MKNKKGLLPVNVNYIRYLRSEKGKRSLNPLSKFKRAGPNELTVYILSLLSRANEEDFTCFPSIKKISEDAGISPRTAQRAILNLEEMEWIFVERLAGEANKYTCHHYRKWVIER